MHEFWVGFVLRLVGTEKVPHQTVCGRSDDTYEYSSIPISVVKVIGRKKLLHYFAILFPCLIFRIKQCKRANCSHVFTFCLLSPFFSRNPPPAVSRSAVSQSTVLALATATLLVWSLSWLPKRYCILRRMECLQHLIFHLKTLLTLERGMCYIHRSQNIAVWFYFRLQNIHSEQQSHLVAPSWITQIMRMCCLRTQDSVAAHHQVCWQQDCDWFDQRQHSTPPA